MTVRRDSCSSEAKSFAPLRGKPPYGAPKRKQCKKEFLQIRQKSIQFYKDKSIEKKEAENPHFQTPYPYLRGAP